MRSNVIRVVVALVLAAVGTAVLVRYVETAKAEAVADERQVDVLVIESRVAKGTPARDLAAKVKTIPVPDRARAGDAVGSLDELGELRANADLLPGEQVVKGRFAEAGTALRGEAPAGLLQVTVPLEPERALGGNLRPGDTVGVLLSFDVAEDTMGQGVKLGQATRLELHKVTVTNVQVAGQPTEATAEGKGDVPAAITGKYLVTLAVTGPQAEQLVFTAENGTIWLSAEPEDAPLDGGGAGSVYRGNVIPVNPR